jgi:ribonuclease P protein component
MLPAANRLRRSADIAAVRQHGQRWHTPLVTLYVLPNQREISRFAFVAGRRVGKAVQRNRVKRLCREVTRQHLKQMASGWDCLLVAKDKAVEADYQQLLAAATQLFLRAHLIQPPADQGVAGS